MRTFYVSLHVEKADEALHGSHPAWVRPEYGAKSEPGLVRTYLIEENVYFLKDWLKSGFGEKYLRARDVGSRWDQIVLPTAALLHHGSFGSTQTRLLLAELLSAQQRRAVEG